MKINMPQVKNPALKKNPLMQDVKKDLSVKMYAQQARLLKKVNPAIKGRLLNDQKILANHRILGSMVSYKVSNLSSVERKNADKLFQDMYAKIILRSSNNPAYAEKSVTFLKHFSAALYRKEGKEILEILKKASEAVNKI